jgi:hypothetical protein
MKRRVCNGIQGWKALAGLLAVAGVTLCGCEDNKMPFVVSLEPAYTPVDLEADARLDGSWTDQEGDVTFSFEHVKRAGEQEEPAYRVVVKEKDGSRETSGEFRAHLLHLGGFEFLDFFPENEEDGSAFRQAHLVRAHTIARVEIREDSLEIAFLSASWLEKKLNDQSVDTPHALAGEWRLLTGSTKDVQELIFAHVSDEGAFCEALPLKRLRDPEEEQ